MVVNPVQQNNELSSAQKQRQEMNEVEQRRARQAEDRERARKQEELKPPDQKPTMPAQPGGKTGDMVDITA